MFVTNDADLYEHVLTLSNHGRARGQTKQFWPDMVGFKYKISNVQAAIGCGQIERIEGLISRKREIMSYYRERLESLGGISMNPQRPGTEIGAWMPTVVFEEETGVSCEKLQSAFFAKNIDARVFFHPLSSLPMFDRSDNNHWAYAIPPRAINLPSYHDISRHELDQVCSVLSNSYNFFGNR
jgi:perosamine synthetase